MKYEDIEDAIIAKLVADYGTSIQVIPTPENQASSVKPYEKPRVTVSYYHSMFGEGRYGDRLPTVSTDGVIEEENIQIKITIDAKKLRGDGGVYDLLVKVRQSLLGLEPLGLDKLKLIETKFEEYAENLFSYSLMFGTKGYVVQAGNIDDEVPIAELTFDDNFELQA